jgi:hypothetical protein
MSQSTVNLEKYTRPIIEPFKKQTHFFVGFTGSAKSTGLETIGERLLDAGNTGFDAYGGEFHESAYWCVTMGCCFDPDSPCNCGQVLDKNGKPKLDDDGNPIKLGYETDYGRYPMTLLVPHDFVICDRFGNETEKPLDNYNDNRFSIWEYKRYIAQQRARGIEMPIVEYDHNNPPQRPQGSPKVKWIRIVRLPKAVWTTSKKGVWDNEANNEIRKIFIEELRYSRDEGHSRVVVFNIGFWPIEFTRMFTLGLLIRSLEQAKKEVFYPPLIFDRKWDDWTPQEKTHDKIFMLFRELGEVANASFKTDLGGWSTFIRRALGWYIKKGRQLGCSLIGDMQRPEDVMPGIRDHADWFHIKNSPLSLLGDTWKWFIDWLDKEREEELQLTNWNYEKVNESLPRVQDLSESTGWAVSRDDIKRLTRYKMPKHHHWTPSDHWDRVTGIYWKYGETESEKGGEGEVSHASEIVPDNTIEKVTMILSMMANEKLREKAIKDYKLETSNGKWGWKNFVFPIYQDWIMKKEIQTNKVRPTDVALSVWYNRAIKENTQ